MASSETQAEGAPKGRGYLAESIEELKKVHTPTREETIRSTWVVVLIIVIIAFCLFVLDLVFNWFMTAVIS
jgi:preprotein translocase subunit SecE